MARSKKGVKLAVIIGVVALAGLGAFVGCSSANTQPVARVAEAPAGFVKYPVQLDGTGSEDADGDELTFNWRLLSIPEGSQVVLTGTSTASIALTPDKVGAYVVGLVVGDGKSYSESTERTVTAQPWFSDVSKAAGVTGLGIGERFSALSSDPMAGAAWGDYDGDGDQDLYVAAAVVNPAVGISNRLYRNNGDGTFTDVGVEAGAAFVTNRESWTLAEGMKPSIDPGTGLGEETRGVLWSDYDNDGDLDFYAVNSGAYNTKPPWKVANRLYRNNGDGSFTSVAPEAGVADTRFALGASWADYDNDGDLDLAIANYARIEKDEKKKTQTYNEAAAVYRNNGDGTFTDVAAQLGIGQDPITPKSEWDIATVRCGSPWQPFWFDYDGDGDQDIFYTCETGTGTNLLYRNNGDETFTDVTQTAGLWGSTGHGIDAGDYDNDGDLDLILTDTGTNHLWRNNGDGTFSEVTSEAGVEGRGGVGWGTAFFDYDNDGNLDIVIAAGDWSTFGLFSARETYNINLFYRNNGDGTFEDLSEISGLGLTPARGLRIPSISRGLALADYDEDGDLDVFFTSSDDWDYLYRNDIANDLGNNWLKVKLEGTASNRNGIGATVEVTAGDLTRVEQLYSGGSFLSGDALELHFGLGDRSVIETIEVRWPSGIVQVVENTAANQMITITEAKTSS